LGFARFVGVGGAEGCFGFVSSPALFLGRVFLGLYLQADLFLSPINGLLPSGPNIWDERLVVDLVRYRL
jgi:hypothetical protein